LEPVPDAQQAGSPDPAGPPQARVPEPRQAPPAGLSDRDRAVLLFEKQQWKHAGAKEQAIRDRFGLSANNYYQVLNALLDRAEALAFEPVLVKRLCRQRSARARSRSAGGRDGSPTRSEPPP
jgi:Protein of unknown function (DUF3263)